MPPIENTENSNSSEEAPPVEGASTEQEQQPDPNAETEGQEPAGKDGDEKPPTLNHEQALAELARVRQEAASHRTKLRETEAALAAAKSPDEVEAALSELRNANAALEREITVSRVARKHGLPDDLAAALQGEDEAALEAHAKVLAKYVPASSEDRGEPRGGLDPTGDDSKFDPVAEFRKARASRY